MVPDPIPLPPADEGARPEEDEREKRRQEIRRLLARGSEMRLADDSVVSVVFTARNLAQIEAEYGSVNAYITSVNAGTEGRIFGDLAFTLGLVLRRRKDDVWDLIDVRQAQDYLEAINAALLEALPPAEDARGNGSGPTTAPLPGPNSSISLSPTGTSDQMSSGT